jgi:hypothetical protein
MGSIQRETRPSIQREDQLTMETQLEQIAVKAANQPLAGHRPTILLYKRSISPAWGCILSSEHVERQLAAILAADVAGSCRLIIDEEGMLSGECGGTTQIGARWLNKGGSHG